MGGAPGTGNKAAILYQAKKLLSQPHIGQLNRTVRDLWGECMDSLLENLDKLHTTELGAQRIRRNLQLTAEDVVQWCRERILAQDAVLERIGKNWYASIGDDKITVNAHSYTIITAHKIRG